MVPSDYVVSALATLMWSEPHDDHLLGMTACGLVVRNRKMAGWSGGDFLTLIRNHDKYSANPPKTPRVLVFGDPNRDDLFRRCLAKADMIYQGREKDITADADSGRGALWYGRLNDCSDWFRDNIVRQMQDHPMVATVGMQKFFL